MKVVFIFTVLIFTSSFCQTDWQRWNASEISYFNKIEESQDSLPDSSNPKAGLVSYARSVYKFLISDLDGDNCPFQPTCSAFFVESVKQTNLFQGALMFADRFTRDLNMLKVLNDYPMTNRNRFYDPPDNYKLAPGKIKIISAAKRLNE